MRHHNDDQPETQRLYRKLKSAVEEVQYLDKYTPSAWKDHCHEMARLFGDLNLLLTLGGDIPEEWVIGAPLSADSDDN
ncbi:hypothetical protein [Streptomyces sp. DG1A-41]|uniref:hypothetical protein n=1 Tax=Streptomyces sp. DG1A-41 TaxID=3125779 RepID=UPI0030D4CF8B